MIADALSRVTSIKFEHPDYTDSLSNIEKILVHQITQIALASQRDCKNCKRPLKGIHH